GNSDDYGQGIALDGSGNAYITGLANSASTTFPLVNLAPFPGTSSYDAFVSKLNASGANQMYGVRLGGSGDDRGQAIAVDSDGNAYLAGTTTSGNFPMASAVQAALGNAIGANNDGFAAKINAAGSGLLYSTYLGGNGSDQATGLAIDAAGNAVITGITTSTNFPTAAPLQAANAGGNEGFITRLTEAPGTNHPPVLAAIGSKAVNSGSSLTFTASATDPEI